MFVKSLASAVAAAAVVSAQSSSTCTQTTFTINSNADATALKSCTTLTGNVVIGNTTETSIQINGPGAINGNLILADNSKIVSFASNSIATISGTFQLARVELLSTLSFTALNSVKEIDFQTLPQLESLGFGGVSKATKVVISDTFLSSLDGLDLVTVDFMDINNNRRLTKHTSKLTNLTTELKLQANGANSLQWEMPSLKWAANLTIANVSSFSIPQVSTVNGSLRFDTNSIVTFSAPNLTSTGGDISFVGHASLTNISLPELTTIGGSLTIVNNTALERLDSLPLIKTVGGAVLIRGNFSEVALPSLNDVKGAFDVQSTTDISSSCSVFNKLAPGSGGQIQGSYTCEGNNADANDVNSSGGSGSSGSGSGSSAAGVAVNMAMLGLSLLGGVVALL